MGRRTPLLAGLAAAVAIIVALLAAGLGRDPSVIASPLVGRMAPDFTLSQLDGPPVTLSKLRGQVVVINFWASWCAECKVEQTTLDQTWRQYQDSGVVVIGVNLEDETAAARGYVRTAASVTVLLAGTVSPRHPGQTISGNPVPTASLAAGSPNGQAPASPAGQKSPTSQQLAAVAAAEAQVKQHPKDAHAHLALADGYAAAGAGQLAAVEYLAVTRLDPANAEANTDLALLAFEVGRAAQGKAMVDHVLAAHPDYPEALYVRGLIDLVGLRQARAAERDLNAYLAVAPVGSHRTAVVTLLALAQSQDHR